MHLTLALDRFYWLFILVLQTPAPVETRAICAGRNTVLVSF